MMTAIDTDVAPLRQRYMELRGPECFGDSRVVRAQRVLFAARGWLLDQQDMTGCGHTLMVWDAHKLPEGRMEALVRCFERVMLHAPQRELLGVSALLKQAQFNVDTRVSLLGASASDVRATVERLDRVRSVPPRWRLVEVSREEEDDTIANLQRLVAASGLTPLPGWYLRGAEGQSCTVVLYDGEGELMGCATVSATSKVSNEALGSAPLQLGLPGASRESMEGERARMMGPPTAVALMTCVRQDMRGQGLGSLLLGAALRKGFERWQADTFYAVWAGQNDASVRMGERCGLMMHPTEGVVFAEVG